jgi:c-di-GMP-related signal transduction protein
MTDVNTNAEFKGRVFIARQPIFDSKKNVFAYELLYRSDLENRAFITDGDYATLKVIANSLLIGLQKLTDGKRAFINFDRGLLLGRVPLLFPSNILGVEILETITPDRRLIKVCNQIKNDGYLMILDNFVFDEEYQPLLPMVDIIKIDFCDSTPEERCSIFQKVNSKHIKFLAAKIESQQDFKEALKLGYHYFQGFFFQQPALISRKEMPGYKLNYLSILRKLYDPAFEVDQIEEIIKRDVSLTYKLLRFINSAAHGFKVTIRSIRHALILLGKREIKRWLTIIVMSGIGRDKPIELMNAAIIRARFCELIALEFKLQENPTDLFLIGMLSMMDAFLDRPLPEILEELPLAENIKFVLLEGEGQARKVLELVRAFEKADWESFSLSTHQLNVDEEKLAFLYLEAVEWAKLLSPQE